MGLSAAWWQRRRLPNILFFLSDQHRYDWIGATPALGVKTPALDSLAKMGVRIRKCIVASPLCGPSRACLASGREYARCGVRDNNQDYPLHLPTFYQALRASGYHVVGVGKFDLHKATFDWGVDGRRFLPEWGFSDGIDNAGKTEAILSGEREPRDPYMAFLHRRGLAQTHVEDYRRRQYQNAYLNTEPTPLPEDAYCDNWIAVKGLEFLRAFPTSKPWMLQVNFVGPQLPLDITRRMERTCRGRKFPPPIDAESYTQETHLAIRQNYTAMIENIDRWVGAFLDELKRRGQLENTLVVYSSDHGEMLGDHDRWGQGLPYQPAVNVPLYVFGPGVERNVVSNALVSHIDLAATFLDYAGVPRLASMEGQSLRPLLEGRTSNHREFVRSALGSWSMVFDGRYKLIRGFNPSVRSRLPRKGQKTSSEFSTAFERPVLFDLKLDANETDNLARKAPSQVHRLSKLLGS
ncbi:MAG: sulfatase-like hydrolase/transferase [Bryobacteraceae bacterium]|nr:sulfatase-like hydrolase/transferase [Bryobacteraceae bacterium]MDW8380417.1 sulfatase-like hydrolase/transferase [Bryobacterales bacterium]